MSARSYDLYTFKVSKPILISLIFLFIFLANDIFRKEFHILLGLEAFINYILLFVY